MSYPPSNMVVEEGMRWYDQRSGAVFVYCSGQWQPANQAAATQRPQHTHQIVECRHGPNHEVYLTIRLYHIETGQIKEYSCYIGDNEIMMWVMSSRRDEAKIAISRITHEIVTQYERDISNALPEFKQRWNKSRDQALSTIYEGIAKTVIGPESLK